MGRKPHFAPLHVYLNARRVGELTRARSGAVSFVYDQVWLDWEHRLPISLSLPLKKERYIGAPVMAVFDNLLPDNDAIRRRVAERVGANGVDAFSLLSEIGRDCVGALQFLPADTVPQPLSELTGRLVSDEQIAAILDDLDVSPLGIRRDVDFRISVAGAQEKTALLRIDGQWFEPSGTTPTTHIIKPQIGRLPNGMDLSDSVENEYLCLKLMEGFGLRVANAEIAQFGERKALVVERFDRLWAKDGRLIRLPQEDCCQALSIPPTRKYQNEGGPGIVEIMDMLRGSDEPTKDRTDFFKANVLFWMMGATDGHAKNFSISLLPGGRFNMTPLYDVLTVQPTFDAKQLVQREFRLAMRMGSANRYRVTDITGRHIMQTGLAAGLSRAAVKNVFEEIQDRLKSTVEAIIEANAGLVPSDLGTSLADALRQRSEKLSLVES